MRNGCAAAHDLGQVWRVAKPAKRNICLIARESALCKLRTGRAAQRKGSGRWCCRCAACRRNWRKTTDWDRLRAATPIPAVTMSRDGATTITGKLAPLAVVCYPHCYQPGARQRPTGIVGAVGRGGARGYRSDLPPDRAQAIAAKIKNGRPRSMKLPAIEAAISSAKQAQRAARRTARAKGSAVSGGPGRRAV